MLLPKHNSIADCILSSWVFVHVFVVHALGLVMSM
jgi:hypothetical protein